VDSHLMSQETRSREGAMAVRCVVCREALPLSRMPLLCSSCGDGVHPSCAGRVERGDGWGNRRLFCPACVGSGGA
jgi:hypothetical protein